MSLTKSIADAVARDNIRVNAVCPQYIESDLLNGVIEREMNKHISTAPQRRPASPAPCRWAGPVRSRRSPTSWPLWSRTARTSLPAAPSVSTAAIIAMFSVEEPWISGSTEKSRSITGGSSGIGLAIAEKLAEEGCKVAMRARRAQARRGGRQGRGRTRLRGGCPRRRADRATGRRRRSRPSAGSTSWSAMPARIFPAASRGRDRKAARHSTPRCSGPGSSRAASPRTCGGTAAGASS